MTDVLKKPCAVCGGFISSNDLTEHENSCFDKLQRKHEMYVKSKENLSSSDEGHKMKNSQANKDSSDAVNIAEKKAKPELSSKSTQSDLSLTKSVNTAPVQMKDRSVSKGTMTYENEKSDSPTTNSKISVDSKAESGSNFTKFDVPLTPEKAQCQALMEEIKNYKPKSLKSVENNGKEVKHNHFDQETEKNSNSKETGEFDSNSSKTLKPERCNGKEELKKSIRQPGEADRKCDSYEKNVELDSETEQRNTPGSKLSDKELLENSPYNTSSTKSGGVIIDEPALKENPSGSESYSEKLPELTDENEAAYQSYLDNLVPCSFCGRRFTPNRIMVHENACIENPKKKKRQYVTPD